MHSAILDVVNARGGLLEEVFANNRPEGRRINVRLVTAFFHNKAADSTPISAACGLTRGLLGF